MGTSSTIQLAKPFTPEKLKGGVFVSEKLDGVPVVFTVNKVSNLGGSMSVICADARTRQNELAKSTMFVAKGIELAMQSVADNENIPVGTEFTVVAEIIHETYKNFKDISGVVRTQSPQTGLRAMVFDFIDSRKPNWPFKLRYLAMQKLINMNAYVGIVPQFLVPNVDAAVRLADNYKSMNPGIEGMVFRDPDETWQPGKRTWGYQKYIQDPTIDLQLHSVEQAISEDGTPLGMVGRLNFKYKGGVVGVGPGKMTHAERTAFWVDLGARRIGDTHYTNEFIEGPMATIKYKHDPSYDALRQATFQHWRYDKDEPDA